MEMDVARLREILTDPEALLRFNASRTAALGASEADLAKAQWMDRVDSIHIPDSISVQAEAQFDTIAKRALKRSGEGICTVLAAETGAGKTHILNRLLRNEHLRPRTDEFGRLCPLVYVKTPAPCNLERLGKRIYSRLTNKRMVGARDAAVVWETLAYQLIGQRVSMIVLDEFQHLLVDPRGDHRRSVLNTIKTLVQPDPMNGLIPDLLQPYPLQVVLSGTPTILKVLKMDGELNRRSPKICIAPHPKTKEGKQDMRIFLKSVEAALGFPVPSGLSSIDMCERFFVATDGYRGRAMHLIKEAAFLAIEEGASSIDRVDHLGRVVNLLFQRDPRSNPFLVADPADVRNIVAAEWESKTLLRGNNDDDDDDNLSTVDAGEVE